MNLLLTDIFISDFFDGMHHGQSVVTLVLCDANQLALQIRRWGRYAPFKKSIAATHSEGGCIPELEKQKTNHTDQVARLHFTLKLN